MIENRESKIELKKKYQKHPGGEMKQQSVLMQNHQNQLMLHALDPLTLLQELLHI